MEGIWLSDLFFLSLQFISSFLACIVGVFTIRSYLRVGRSYLLSFAAGFLLFAVSYLLIIPIVKTFRSGELGSTVEMMSDLMQFVGTVLVAYTYFLRRHDSNRLPTAILISALLLLLLSVLLFVGNDIRAIDEYFFAANTLLMVYVFYNSSKSYIDEPMRANALAPVGFGFLCFSQYSWLIWALDGGQASFLLANILRQFGLLLFIFALRRGR